MDRKFQEITLGGYRLAVDVEGTRAYYAAHPLPWVTCTCDGCRNFVRAVQDLPEAVRAFFDRLGLDPEKPAETSWNTRWRPGPGSPEEISGDGWYHVCGKILEQAEPPENQRFGEWLAVTEKWEAAFGAECYLLPENFPEPCFQMDVLFSLPWMLETEPEEM